LEAEIGTAAFDFWTPRLNDYKNAIDQSLSSADLAELNQLRVRWAIVLDQGMRSAVSVRHRDTAAVRFDVEAMGRMSELMAVHSGATKLAARYRAAMDRMSAEVMDDITSFATEMADRSDRFVESNRSSFENDPEAARLLERRGDLRKAVEDLRTQRGRKGLESIYTLAIEPIVLLYDGTDLKTLLGGSVPSGISVNGIELPESSLLSQNVPNPASTYTTITYTLPTASTHTKLEVFNVTGALVAAVDHGARQEGEHHLRLDVTSLPAGSYFYRLSVRTDKGPRVASRVMRVVGEFD